jgi:Zn finger protein HypA/HybF involved in hydrogenase expression
MHEHTFIQAIIKPIKDKEKVDSIEIDLGEISRNRTRSLHGFNCGNRMESKIK